MMRIDIDNRQVKAYTDKLRKMHRSDFPLAVRGTLNDLAFDTKQKTLLKHADKQFIIRNPGFFKKHSGVTKATGFNIATMKSVVGIEPKGSKAAAQLVKQEYGGGLKRPLIYTDVARISKSKNKLVSKRYYLNQKQRLRKGANLKRSDKSQFVADAVIAKRENKVIIRNNIVFLVDKIKFSSGGSNRKVFVKLIPVASVDPGRNVRLTRKPFLKNASQETIKKVNRFFAQNAQKRFDKAMLKR